MDNSPIRVLLVDDDEDDYIITRDLLYEIEERRFDLEWVASYDVGLEAIGHNQHDVYLLDYRLGNRSGLELLREALRNGCKVPMILLTGQGDREVDIEAMKAGAADYLVKGRIDTPLLDRSIRYAIERRRAEKVLKRANADLASREKALRKTLSDLKEAHEELKTTQSQLIQAEKLESVGMLAAGVAHEVKNPLAIILQWIHYLSTHLTTHGDNIVMALQEVNNAVKRANSVVKGLLDFSAASELSLTTEELNSVVEQSLLLVRHELDRYHVNAVRELGEDLPPVRLDRNKIEQVFVNVFMNAVHAMPEGGTLTVKAYAKQLKEISHDVGSRKADHFRIGDTVVMAEVEDTGKGIPEDQLSKIFDPFFTTNSTGKGTGLGLTVTKQIIDLHGGTIDIGNRKGGGVRVSIMFKAQRRE